MTTQVIHGQDYKADKSLTSGQWRRYAPPVLAWLVGLSMPVLMLRVVLSASPMQWGDFWTSLARFTNGDGSVHIRGFFTTQNHHPTFFPQMVYWAIVKLAGGSNIVTGLLDLVLGGITVFLLWALLPASLSRLLRYTLTALLSVFIFSMHGVFNYGFGMSGIAWFSANIGVLAAIWFAQRSLTAPALFFCAAASCCYGSGYLSWVCVIVIAFLKAEPWWRKVLPAIGFVITIGLAASGYEALPIGGLAKPDIPTQLGVFLSFLGGLASGGADSALPITIGAGLLALGGFAAYTAVRSRTHLAELTPWIAIGVYAVGSGALVSQARDVLGSNTGTSSRYTSLTALLWCAVVVMAVTLWARRLDVVVGVAAALALLTTATAASVTQSMKNDFVPKENLKAVALSLSISDAVPEIPIDSAGVPRAKALGIYPFNADFNAGCDQWKIGSVVPPAQIKPAKAAATAAGTVTDTVTGSGRVIKGYAVLANHDADCVMVVDRSSTVVGGGIVGVPFAGINSKVGGFTGRGGFTAVVPVKAGSTTVLVVGQGGIWSVPALPAAKS